MNQKLGYILSGTGLALLALGLNKSIAIGLKIQFLAEAAPSILTTIGIILTIVGVILMNKNQRKKQKEVPIYKGKEIVGYRRH